MQDQTSTIVFDQERASSYDKQFAKMAPMRDALHLFIRLVLLELPDNARILCVGAGTGAELLDLAVAFPNWRFTAVEPAAAMLDICRQRAQERGVADRCSFHTGYLDTLPPSDEFDAATCILVSHFLLDPEARRDLFAGIAARLRPGGYLVNADLASDMSTSAHEALLEVWLRMMTFTGMPAQKLVDYRASLGQAVAVLPPHEVESIIVSAGFEPPVPFFQALLIHAWYSTRAA